MTIDDKPTCPCLAEWIPVFESAIGRDLQWFQLVGDAKASAGFHRGGGSGDCAPLTEAELRTARNMGAAAWNRWWKDNFHAHLRLNGCPHNTVAQPQVDDLNEGRDGTGPLYDNRGEADNGPRDGVRWPLRTWQEGLQWAREQMEDDMLTPDEIEQVAQRAAQLTTERIMKRFGIDDPDLEQDRSLAGTLTEIQRQLLAIQKKLGAK